MKEVENEQRTESGTEIVSDKEARRIDAKAKKFEKEKESISKENARKKRIARVGIDDHEERKRLREEFGLCT